MHGHSPNNHDVMFLAATPELIAKLSERDKATIKRIYQTNFGASSPTSKVGGNIKPVDKPQTINQ
jgi:hypothetical protein